MKEQNLEKLLNRFSKKELINAIVVLSRACFPVTPKFIIDVILRDRLDAINKKLDDNLAKSKEITQQMQSFPETEKNISNPDFCNAMEKRIDLSHEFDRLQAQYDKIEKELFG